MTKPSCECAQIRSKRNLKNDYYSFHLGPFSRAAQCRPGQFLHLKLPGSDVLFRRAFSVASIEPDRREIEVIFKVCGRGTKLMSRMHPGDPIDILGPLGNAFKLPRKSETAVMVAGGVGFPPLLNLAATMVANGFDPSRIVFCYGGRSAGDIIERTRIRKLGIEFHPVTEDGSLGEKGLVTAPVRRLLEANRGARFRLYGCGPEGMLKAVNALGLELKTPGQISLEAPMPCGIGVCLGCVVPLTAGGHARVCCDGPVFEIGEVAL
ncbi:MAG TPA: dihydroorotate dehydrogenase electron transfer subunit [candidate division Zixibacteria bacterium]|nr:dihydroorotate dehydrogenase electron transfer subunit [candidate division Zixibacteria bacterium]